MIPDVSARVRMAAGDHSSPGVLRMIDLNDPLTTGMLRRVSGRPARTGDELVVSQRLASRFGIEIGESLTWAGHSGPGTVVGVYRDPQDTTALFAITLPTTGNLADLLGHAAATDGTALSAGWLVGGTDADADRLRDSELAVITRADLKRLAANRASDDADPTGVFAVELLALAEIGLLIGAALAIVARRRQYELGLLAAVGADSGIRAGVLTMTGVMVGAIGSTLAVPVGLGAARVAMGPLGRRAEQDWQELRFSVPIIIALVLAGILTTTIASWATGRSVSRLAPVAALRAGSGPRSPGTGGRRLAGLLALLVGSCIGLAGGGAGKIPVLVAASVLVALIASGGILAVWLPRLRSGLSGLPLPLRTAIRDASDHAGRSAALVISISALFVISLLATTVIAGKATVADRDYIPSAPAGQAVFLSQQQPTAAAVSAAARTLDAERFSDFQTVGMPSQRSGTERPRPATVHNPLLACVERKKIPAGSDLNRSGCFEETGLSTPFPGVAAADPGLVEMAINRRLTPQERQAYQSGSALVLDPRLVTDGRITLRALGVRVSAGDDHDAKRSSFPETQMPAVAVGTREYTSLPMVVLSPATATARGLQLLSRYGVLFDPGSVTTSQEDRARTALTADDDYGELTVERGPRGVTLLKTYLSVIGLGLLLTTVLIVSITVALSTVEMRQDFAVLASVGAPPRTRRLIASGQALVLSGLGVGVGALLGTAGGLGLLAAAQVPPTALAWSYLLPAGLATIATAGLVGYLSTPRANSVTGRDPR